MGKTINSLILPRNELGIESKHIAAPVQCGRGIAMTLSRKTNGVTYLDLGHNRLGPRAGLAFAEALVEESTIVSTLMLPGNFFGEESGEAFGRALLKNSSLTML